MATRAKPITQSTFERSPNISCQKLQLLGNKCLSSQIFNYRVKLKSSTAIYFACLLKESKAASFIFVHMLAHWYPAPEPCPGGPQFNPQLRRSFTCPSLQCPRSPILQRPS